MRTIKILGDKYKTRETYDIDDFGIGIYGYEIYNEDDIFLRHIEGICKLKDLKNYLKFIFYKSYEGTYSYNK